MYNNDYIVMIDVNGQPFIAHAFGDKAKAAWGSLSGRAVKYKDKVRTAGGGWRSIYDTVTDKLGYDERDAYRAALRLNRGVSRHGTPKTEAQREGKWQVRRRLDSAKEAYDNTVLGKIDKARKKIKDTASSARVKSRRAKHAVEKYANTSLASIKDSYGKTKDKAADKIKDKLGYDEEERYNKMRDQYQALVDTSKRYPDSVSAAEIERRRQDMVKAREELEKTLHGKALKRKAKRTVSGK